jgi:uncharacterized protein YjeT (DUF2065 family)
MLFGCEEYAQRSSYAWAELARRIYGDEEPAVKKALRNVTEKRTVQAELGNDPQKWRTKIKESFPSPESFLNLPFGARKHFEIAGRRLVGLASLFGTPGHPISFLSDHYRLAEAIYGKDDPAVQQALRRAEEKRKEQDVIEAKKAEIGTDPEAWKALLKEKFSTPEAFLAMSKKERLSPLVAGLRINAIARIFGFEGDPGQSATDFVTFAGILYGNTVPVIQKTSQQVEQALGKRRAVRAFQTEFGTEPEKWRDLVRATYPTSESFLDRSHGKIIVAGMGLKKLATIFGTEGDPFGHLSDHLKLAAKIYQEDAALQIRAEQQAEKDRVLKELGADPVKWRARVRELYPDPGAFIRLTSSQRYKIKIDNMTLFGVARIFGGTGDPRNNFGTFLKLAEAVYGPDDPVIKSAKEKIKG